MVGEAADGEQAVDAVRRFKPDVALMDIRMPTVDGLEATRRIVEAGTATRIIILTTFDIDEYVYAGLRTGASGFLLKDATPEQLIAAIHVVVTEGEAVLAPSVTRRVVEAFARAQKACPRVAALQRDLGGRCRLAHASSRGFGSCRNGTTRQAAA